MTPGGVHLSRGITIVEVLVTVVVIAVLAGLVAVGLGWMRSGGVATRDLATMRSHANTFAVYAGDHRDALPHFFEPGLFSNTLESSGGLTLSGFNYFDAFQSWHVFFAGTGYITESPTHEAFFPAGYLQEGTATRHTPFAYPCAFVADPAYWNPTSRLGPEAIEPPLFSQYRGTRLGEVRFPAAKTLMVQTWSLEKDGSSEAPSAASREIRVVTVDGAGRSVRPEERLSGYFSGDGFNFREFGAVHYRDTPPMLHTLDGVRGRDLR